MFQVRKDGFKDNPSVPEELDLVEEDDQFTHMLTLDDATSGSHIKNKTNINNIHNNVGLRHHLAADPFHIDMIEPIFKYLFFLLVKSGCR